MERPPYWLLLLLLLLGPATLPAQTLARPGWAGSGLTQETWWQDAIFYRIAPPAFQDSAATGTGDLRGIAQRLGYLQSLGIDALILERPFDESGFDDLLSESARYRIRLIVALQSTTPDLALAEARSWLARGAAGIEFNASPSSGPGSVPLESASFLAHLRAVKAGLPGERVIIARFSAMDTFAARATRGRGADLVDFQVNFSTSTALANAPDARAGLAANLHRALADTEDTHAGVAPLLVSDEGLRSAASYAIDSTPARTLGINKAVAAMLLASRGGVALLYGQELGLESLNPAAIMQWTPSNLTRPNTPPPVSEPAPPPPPAPDPNVYGAYVPYVPPPPPPKKKAPDTDEPPFDPDALPGFSTVPPHIDADAADTTTASPATLNAATEDHDPASLLNFYKRLIQLHHGNSSLRRGSQHIFNHDAENALVWLRRAPAGSRTAATVIIACNLSGSERTLSLDRDLAQLHMHSGKLRPLLESAPSTIPQTPSHLTLPPYSVFIAELYH